MKPFTTLFISLIAFNSFAQKIFVEVSPTTAKLFINGTAALNPSKISVENPSLVCVALQRGYVNHGFTIGDLKKKEIESYPIKLEKVQLLSSGYNSKKIQFEKITDGTGKIERPSYASPYGIVPGLSLSDSRYTNAMNKELETFGYKSINNSMFEGNSDNPQLKISGEIKHFSKGTRGKGFQVSILVDWFVYSNSEKKVVLELKNSAGYSDLGLTFEEELMQALGNALTSVMSNNEFQKIANSKGEEIISNKGDVLSAIILPKFNYSKKGSFSDLVKSSLLSVVTIRTDLGFGSGFIISQTGHIITNQHVISNAKKIEVIFSNGFQFDAEEIRSNKDRDVALIKIIGKGFSPMPLNDKEDDFQIGTEVIAIGTPHDQNLTQSVTKGIISGKRIIDNLPYLQTDVAVNSGNSGGPLISTESGMVIGVVVSKIKAVGVEGISFAIPIEECKKTLNIVFE